MTLCEHRKGPHRIVQSFDSGCAICGTNHPLLQNVLGSVVEVCRPYTHTAPGVSNILRVAGPHFQVVHLIFTPVTVQIIPSIWILFIWPVDMLPVVTVGIMESVDFVGGFKGNHNMPDRAGFIVDPKNNIPRTYL